MTKNGSCQTLVMDYSLMFSFDYSPRNQGSLIRYSYAANVIYPILNIPGFDVLLCAQTWKSNGMNSSLRSRNSWPSLWSFSTMHSFDLFSRSILCMYPFLGHFVDSIRLFFLFLSIYSPVINNLPFSFSHCLLSILLTLLFFLFAFFISLLWIFYAFFLSSSTLGQPIFTLLIRVTTTKNTCLLFIKFVSIWVYSSSA